MPGRNERPRRVVVGRDGPILVEGPVVVVNDDGTTTRSDRFVAAICTCRRSRTYPWCDTSHRRRVPAGPPRPHPDDGSPRPEDRDTREGDRDPREGDRDPQESDRDPQEGEEETRP
ncbi:CDGSH iron-sulfur domain-containing protein [Streptomyces sp. C11-1]|uniref:CDGSH iron-sulfur domain-containing protein n=1 Tax=Streptomyces sp. C11-1 TaxID=3444503 RepID=UPI0037D9C262